MLCADSATAAPSRRDTTGQSPHRRRLLFGVTLNVRTESTSYSLRFKFVDLLRRQHIIAAETGEVRMPSVARMINVADLRNAAHRRLPKAVFEYLDGGAE